MLRWSTRVVRKKVQLRFGSLAFLEWAVERDDSRCVLLHLVPDLFRFHHCRCSWCSSPLFCCPGSTLTLDFVTLWKSFKKIQQIQTRVFEIPKINFQNNISTGIAENTIMIWTYKLCVCFRSACLARVTRRQENIQHACTLKPLRCAKHPWAPCDLTCPYDNTGNIWSNQLRTPKNALPPRTVFLPGVCVQTGVCSRQAPDNQWHHKRVNCTLRGRAAPAPWSQSDVTWFQKCGPAWRTQP